MHRFYLPPEQCLSPTLLLDEREAYHALHVLRLQRHDRVAVLDGAGHEFLCETVEVSRESVRLAVRQKNEIAPLPYQVTLVQGVPKGKLIEAIIQKATELGVHRIVPLLSERVVTRPDEERLEHKLEHWRLVAIEAIKQCGSAWLPQIDPAQTPKSYLARQEHFELPLVASLQPGARHVREWFARFQSEHQRRPKTLCVWVGPEGDFTPAELHAAKAAGALPIGLGRLVLRSETAAVYCLSVLNHEMQSPEESLLAR